MIIEQIYDKSLAHASYAVANKGKVLLVDPGRDPSPYLDFAKKNNAEIVAVFETHPHADFASSHLEFQQKHGAKIYINPKVGVSYDYEPLDHNDEVTIGGVTIRTLFTPGHSPDHNSYLLIDENGKPKAVFTGDALFVGDVGRPDLREGAGNIQVKRNELAAMMYDTIHDIFAKLPDDVIVYPAHGAGSLCGKNLSDELHSTIGRQKKENWAFQIKDKDVFVDNFLDGQPFIPKYFPHSVELNRKGHAPIEEGIQGVSILNDPSDLDEGIVIVDTRPQEGFKAGHIKGALNIQATEDDKYETWLGSVLDPEEPFYLIAEDEEALNEAIRRTAKIGYEKYIKGAMVHPISAEHQVKETPLEDFDQNRGAYTILDVRNEPEVKTEKPFESSVNIPLPELKERLDEVPLDKPIVVHCAGGYRSTIGASLLEKHFGDKVDIYDLSTEINNYKDRPEVRAAGKIPENSRKIIGEMISSAESVVGIDAKEAHIIIIHRLLELDQRLDRIEKLLEDKNS